MTVRQAMLKALKTTGLKTINTDKLDQITCDTHFFGSHHTTRRVAGELVTAGVLTRTAPGQYKVNAGKLTSMAKGL